jgi:hypothetical protein
VIAETALAGAVAILTALVSGELLGNTALKFRGGRFLLSVLVQFRAGYGFWWFAIALAVTHSLSPLLALGLGAGLLEGVLLAQWICQLSPSTDGARSRGGSLGRLGTAIWHGERRRTEVILHASVLSLTHVLVGREIFRICSNTRTPGAPVSYVALGLGLFPLVLLMSTEVRHRLGRAFR